MKVLNKKYRLLVLKENISRAICYKYEDIFSRTVIIQHRIITGNNQLIRQLPRRISIANFPEVEKLIENMKNCKVLEPSNSLPVGN